MSYCLAWRWLWRDIRQGDALVVLLALTIAIAAMTAVGLFTDRVDKLLGQQANNLVAADAVLNADHPVHQKYKALSQQYQLATAETMTFPSMVLAEDKSQLVTIKGVSETYPLRGDIQLRYGTRERAVKGAPKRGEVWADQRLLDALSLTRGQAVTVGQRQFVLTQVVTREPDAAMDLYNFIPRLLINTQDLPSTGLIQTGSRIRYRLLVAGAPNAVQAWQQAVSLQLKRGERIENARESRPELNTALERADTFLRLAALTTVCLTAAALLLAVRRYVNRHVETAAILRTLGCSQWHLLALFMQQFIWIGLLAIVLGTVLGWLTQFLLVQIMAGLFPAPLPSPSGLPFIFAPLISIILLFGFTLLPLINLANVPALRVLRRELEPQMHTVIGAMIGAIALLAVMRWQTGAWSLSLLFGGGMLVTVLIAAFAGWGLLHLISQVIPGYVARMGIRNLLRHRVVVSLQMGALALGVMAILLLTVVRDDLINAWENTLPATAPNRFIINIQPQNIPTLLQMMQENGLNKPILQPMLRARLLRIQDKTVQPHTYPDARTQSLAAREFNLSWGEALRQDNQLVAGQPLNNTENAFSVEADIAKRLGIRLGDVLVFSIGGTEYSAPVTSLRKVSWDSFRVNFFVTGTQKLLGQEPGSWITSFYLPPEKRPVVYALTQAMPNLTIIDVETILAEVRRIIQQATQALQLVFIFCIAAGLVMLLALIQSLFDARLQDVAVLRTLGASNRLLRKLLVIEWMVLGGISGLVAGSAAALIGFFTAKQLLHLEHVVINGWLPLIACVGTAVIVLLVSFPFLRRLLRVSPLALLQEGSL